jgi:hypothetical protein
MFAKQVVQLVAARGRFGDQMLVIQVLQAAAGGFEGGAAEGGGGVAVEAGAGDQSEAAEQPPLVFGEVVVGQVERRRYR